MTEGQQSILMLDAMRKARLPELEDLAIKARAYADVMPDKQSESEVMRDVAGVIAKTKHGYQESKDLASFELVNPSFQSRMIKDYIRYLDMKMRLYELTVPTDSPLRWGPGNGIKSGKLKPTWVVQLQKDKEARRQFHWIDPDYR